MAVDDQVIMVEAIRQVLEAVFHTANIQTFTDPVRALEHLNQTDPDLLTLDWSMPRLGGDELLGFLAQKGVTYPILGITGYAQQISKQVAKYKAAGLRLSLVARPFTRQDLLSQIPVLCGAPVLLASE